MAADPPLSDLLERHGQGHLLRWWGQLDDDGRRRLEGELRALDLPRLDDLIARLVFADEATAPEAGKVHPVAVHRLPRP